MRLQCPKDPTHTRFLTTATMSEDWLVDEHAGYLDHLDHTVARFPKIGEDDFWCADCEGEVVAVVVP